MDSKYIFLPWLRSGLARRISEHDPLIDSTSSESQASVSLDIKVLADDIEKNTITQKIQLTGPGDIIGIHSTAIVKTEPHPGVNNFEPNFFPYVEFYDEDFPWRYTPAKAANELRLRPWIALVVLEESEFERRSNVLSGGSKVIFIKSGSDNSVFPPADQLWAWAHVQINDSSISDDLGDAQLRNEQIGKSLSQNPNLGVSRLICPRRLKANTQYFAFVIPAFEKGRVAGLGGEKNQIDAAGRFQPSWSTEQHYEPNHYPVYFQWSFKTADGEDFEFLARKIKPQDLSGTDVGRLWYNASNPGFGDRLKFTGRVDTGEAGFLPFEGALRLPGEPLPDLTQSENNDVKNFVGHLSDLLNLGTQYREKSLEELKGFTQNVIWEEQDDPLLVPPIYGRWYADAEGNPLLDPVQSGNWLENLNLNPSLRAVAALGTQIIQQNQEDFMDRAWGQLAGRLSLNQQIHRLRFAQEVTKATFKKHFGETPSESGTDATSNKQLSLTFSMHAIVKGTEDKSLAGVLNDFKGETTFVQPVYRRFTRTNGPVARRIKNTSGQNTFSSLTMFQVKEFSSTAFLLLTHPPFQNFSSKTIIERAKSSQSVFMLMQLQKPNWLSDHGIPLGFGLASSFKNSANNIVQHVLPLPLTLKLNAPDWKVLMAKVVTKINPVHSFKIKIAGIIPSQASGEDQGSDEISPFSFNPFFSDPAYEYLARINRDLFIPNLDKIRPNSFALLQSNQKFIEALLIGMNQEMAYELLWRGFPADMNATFFRQFWDVSDNATPSPDTSDILPTRTWAKNAALGRNFPKGSFPSPLIFVIKADLLKKYPNLTIYAQRAKLEGGFRKPNNEGGSTKSPIFIAYLDTDYLLAGFALDKAEVIGNDGGWYFVIAERPGEMHFGMDVSRDTNSPASNTDWNDLAWTDLPANCDLINLTVDLPPNLARGRLRWGKGEDSPTSDPTKGNGDSAQMAAILYQRPVRVFIHASQLVS